MIKNIAATMKCYQRYESESAKQKTQVIKYIPSKIILSNKQIISLDAIYCLENVQTSCQTSLKLFTRLIQG